MTETVAGGLRLPLTELLGRLAAPLGLSAREAIGLPVAVDLRFLQHADGLFVSGVAADLVELIAAATGATVDHESSAPAVRLVPVDARGVTPHVVETGPAGFRADGPGEPVGIVAGGEEPASAVEQAGLLRQRLRAGADRLRGGLRTTPDADILARLCAAQSDYAALAFEDVAASRELLGHFLVDAGDRFDDERLDQLGDAYVNLAPSWAALVDDARTIADVFTAERAYAELMSNAADPPTRYAF